MKVFVPFSDEMMDRPGFAELLVPYQPGFHLLNQIDESRLVTDYKSVDLIHDEPSAVAGLVLNASVDQ